MSEIKWEGITVTREFLRAPCIDEDGDVSFYVEIEWCPRSRRWQVIVPGYYGGEVHSHCDSVDEAKLVAEKYIRVHQ